MNTYNPSKVFDELNEMIEQSPLPKVEEVDVWDEAQSNYFNSENCDNDVYQLLRFLKQHYTLIKKQ